MPELLLLDNNIPIRMIQEPYCKKCMNEVEKGKDLCFNCTTPLYIDDWYFNKVKALGIYDSHKMLSNKIPINILSELILSLKYRNIKHKIGAGKLIADGFFQIIQKECDLFKDTAYLTFSPEYGLPLKENNCFFIIKPLLQKLNKNGINIKNISDKTIRLRDVGKNKDKSEYKRFKDINGVHQIDIEDLEGCKIIVIDDVFTTGSTMWDLSRALKNKNAGEINILVAGRHWSFPNWPIQYLNYQKLSFYALLIYFSQFDLIFDYQKINEVEIIELGKDNENRIINAKFEGSRNIDYNLFIDFKEKIITHNCYNYKNERIYNKKFCKHIIKAFINLEESYGEKIEKLLNKIYIELDKWTFNSI